MMGVSRHFVIIAALWLVAGNALAESLGEGLTPLGSEAAGNADGSIPAWNGGITEPPRGWVRGQPHLDPFAADKPLYTITASNMARYASHLTATHKQLLQQYPNSYRMQVYPSRRSCTVPEHVMEATARNHEEAELVKDGNSIEDASVGVPFPVPESAVEIMWNHNFHYRGLRYQATIRNGLVYPDGSNALSTREDKRLFYYGNPETAERYLKRNIDFEWFMRMISGRRAGLMMSFVNTVDQVHEPRKGNMYNPQQRKVLKASPSAVTYDASMPGSENVRVSDDLFLYNGAPDRYDWKLLGKREMIIPYNIYGPTAAGTAIEKLLLGGHLNQSFIRYEKHRVWVVEATLKEDVKHLYHRRVFYIDEDSWIITAVDIYDQSGKHIRGQVGFIKNIYEIPTCVQDFDVMYEFSTGKYHVENLKNGAGPADYYADIRPRDFGRSALRRAAR